MDIFNKHYEKFILVICLMAMMLCLWRISLTINEAKDVREASVKQGRLNESNGDMAPDFDPAVFASKEQWIQRIKDGKRQEVQNYKSQAKDEEIAKLQDRRYFSILTRHSSKPIEEAEAKFRLGKNTTKVASLKETIKTLQAAIDKRIKENGDHEDDTRLAELRIQLEGFEILLANTEMDIEELNKRLSYITRFCSRQGSLVDPQEVICCPNKDCGALVLSTENRCAFCKTEMPVVNPAEVEATDSDGDGLPDAFEIEHAQKIAFLRPNSTQTTGQEGGMGGQSQTVEGALNPDNAADAHEDFDGDSFTNLEEYRFGTDLDDPASYPDPANFTRLLTFDQDKLPVKFMGINDGRAPVEQKANRWRARFAFLRKFRGRDFWERNEDRWEQVRIGGKFTTLDGKTYVVDDLGIETTGEKRAYVKISEYVRPARNNRRQEAAEENAPAPVSYTLYENTELFKDKWYAQLVFLASRSSAMLATCINNSYVVQVNGRNTRVQTRFRIGEGDKITLAIPMTKKKEKEQEAAPANDRMSRFSRRRMNPDMNGEMGGASQSTVETVLVKVEYVVSKFNQQDKTIELTPVAKDDKAKPMVIGEFKEDEKFTLPDGKRYPLIYEGGSTGFGGNEGEMMMEGPAGPGMRRR